MRVTMTSVPKRADRANEDFTCAGPTAAVLIDGAGIPGAESICRHGVAWYAARLGGCLLSLLSLAQDRGLPALLAEAIEQVTDDHRDTCDVADPISPSATVAVLRLSGGLLEYLVLGDSILVLDGAGAAPFVVCDPREVIISRSYQPAIEAAAEGGDERRRLLRDLRANRNRPGGFWLAKDDPRAAAEAIAGSRPISGLTAAVLLSNGAGRIVDRFRLADWPQVLAVLAASGPAEIIRQVREAEARHGVAADDATITYCTDLSEAADAARPAVQLMPGPRTARVPTGSRATRARRTR
ncbi:integrase [Actinomadura sp. ATCC 31491]|uniref:Integrase n=1 Tax=Actinomadura luzonensis TaxID=2805427 RepID=A0ABT0FSH8_9ACTN|nr:integrase [Actinomadura luzonensis]MCK2215297.1 integrase [Actinomadura luzonensis]